MYVTIKRVPIIPELPAKLSSSKTDSDEVRPLKRMALLVLHFEGTGRFCALRMQVHASAMMWISCLRNTNTLNIVLPSTRMFSRLSALPSTLLSTHKELCERLHHFKQITDKSEKLHYIYDFTGSKTLNGFLVSIRVHSSFKMLNMQCKAINNFIPVP